MGLDMKEYIRINHESYDALCSEYDDRAKVRATKGSQFEESAESLDCLILSQAKKFFPKITVLEIGPGSGEMLAFFEKNNCRTVAVDLSPKMAKIARRRSPNTDLVLGNILDVEFLKNKFEIVYAGAVIHLFPLNDALDLLLKIHHWLKPKGFIFINTTIHPVTEEGHEIKRDSIIQIRRFRRKWTENELFAALQNSGFEILDRIFTNEQDRGKQ
jgi:ubiquinone/menaquinone biosynthesis C-methylase UbiE